jgi:hypothetical protein
LLDQSSPTPDFPANPLGTYAMGRWGDKVEFCFIPEGHADTALGAFRRRYPRHSIGKLALGKERKIAFKSIDSTAQAHKNALISFLGDKKWHLFGTIGEGFCPPDDIVLHRLKQIEARLNRRYVSNAYHKKAATERISIIAAFEGDRECGTRHCHFLVYCPPPKKQGRAGVIPLGLMILQIKMLWSELSRTSDESGPELFKSITWNGYEWDEGKDEPVMITRAYTGGADYLLKYISDDQLNDKPWNSIGGKPKDEVEQLEWCFVTPPMFTE